MIVVGLLPLFTFSGFDSLVSFFSIGTGERVGEEVGSNWFFYIVNSPSIFGALFLVLMSLGLPVLVINWGKRDFRNKFLLVLVFIFTHWFGYSFITPHKEARYILPIVPFLGVLCGFGALFLYNLISSSFRKSKAFLKIKIIGVTVLLWILIGIGFVFKFTDSVIVLFGVFASIVLLFMLSFDEKKVSAAGSVVGIVSVALFWA